MPSSKYPFAKQRKFRVIRAIRRYSRVVYECSGTYTVLEDPGPVLRKYPKDLQFTVTLVLAGTGTYERDDAPGDRFSHHELDVIVADKLFEELVVPEPATEQKEAAHA